MKGDINKGTKHVRFADQQSSNNQVDPQKFAQAFDPFDIPKHTLDDLDIPPFRTSVPGL